MIQLPGGARGAIPGHGRDLGFGWRPGGVPGIQIRHSPGLGKCPGGTPSVAAVLGPRFTSGPRTSRLGGGGGSRMMVLMVCVQALAITSPAKVVTSTRRLTDDPPKWSAQM